jgi:hypothetical protein
VPKLLQGHDLAGDDGSVEQGEFIPHRRPPATTRPVPEYASS